MKRFISIICILLILSIVTTSVAAAEITPYASHFFSANTAYLSEVSDSTFRIWFSVFALEPMQELGANYITLERSSDGINWTAIKTYHKSSYTNLIAYNTASHSGYVTYSNRQSGYQYRAYIELYAKNSSGSMATDVVYAYF